MININKIINRNHSWNHQTVNKQNRYKKRLIFLHLRPPTNKLKHGMKLQELAMTQSPKCTKILNLYYKTDRVQGGRYAVH